MNWTDEQLFEAIRMAESAGLATLPSAGELADRYPPPRRVKLRIEDALHRYDPSYRTQVKHVGRRIAIALVAALLAAAMTIMTVSAAREWFIELIRGVFPGQNAVVEIVPNENAPSLMAYVLGYVPEGYEQTEQKIRERQMLVETRYGQPDNPDNIITLKQQGDGVLKYDHSGDEVGTVDINGDEATYSRKGDRHMISWTDGTYNFLLRVDDPDIGKDEAIQIAESIVPAPPV